VILASALVLSEPIPPVRLLGIVLIAAGIVLLSITYMRSPADALPAARLDNAQP